MRVQTMVRRLLLLGAGAAAWFAADALLHQVAAEAGNLAGLGSDVRTKQDIRPLT